MCDHFLGLHRYQQVRQPKAVWRCGTCGRQSYKPVDCCVQPYFAPHQHPSLVGTAVSWAGAAAVRVLAGLSTLLQRWRRSAENLGESCADVQPLHAVRQDEHVNRTEVEETTPVSV